MAFLSYIMKIEGAGRRFGGWSGDPFGPGFDKIRLKSESACGALGPGASGDSDSAGDRLRREPFGPGVRFGKIRLKSKLPGGAGAGFGQIRLRSRIACGAPGPEDSNPTAVRI